MKPLRQLAALIILPLALTAIFGRDNLYAAPIGLKEILFAVGAPFGLWAGWLVWQKRIETYNPTPLWFASWPALLRYPLQGIVGLVALVALALMPGFVLNSIYGDIVDATAKEQWVQYVVVASYSDWSSRRNPCKRRLDVRDRNNHRASLCLHQKAFSPLLDDGRPFSNGEKVVLIGRRNWLGTVIDRVERVGAGARY